MTLIALAALVPLLPFLGAAAGLLLGRHAPGFVRPLAVLPTATSFVLAAVTCGAFVTDVLWGMLSDRVGERKVLIVGLTGMTLALAAVTFFLVPRNGGTPGYLPLAVLLFLAGAFGGSVNGASGRAVMGWFPKEKRGFAISLRVAAVPAGGAIGAAVLPPLAMWAASAWSSSS